MATLSDRFELMKEVGDGSFGSVAVARVRTAGSNIARRGTLVGQRCLMTKDQYTDLDCRLPSKQ
jgi:hypothetical protein